MKTKIIAIAPEDGWAFIVKEYKTYLLRPPYVSSNQIEVSEKDVENAIHLHGFDACDITCDSISEVVRFIKEKYVESMKKQGIGLPSSEQLKELLKYANDEVLLRYLKKADEELIPEGKFNAAESIALDLMKLDKVRNNPEMFNRAIKIFEKCECENKKMKESVIGISKDPLKDKFPNVVKKYDKGLTPITGLIYKQKQ